MLRWLVIQFCAPGEVIDGKSEEKSYPIENHSEWIYEGGSNSSETSPSQIDTSKL